MPRAEPMSLWPLSFDDVLRKMINTPPPENSPKPKRKHSSKRILRTGLYVATFLYSSTALCQTPAAKCQPTLQPSSGSALPQRKRPRARRRGGLFADGLPCGLKNQVLRPD